MRVGATAALGAKYLARSDAKIVGILGSGGMARSFVTGFATVRKIQIVKAYSPNPQHLSVFCREMSEKLGIEVTAEKNASEAIRGADIAASCTNSLEPVFHGRWLEPGMHVAHVSNRELDAETLRRITAAGYLAFKDEPLVLSGFSDDNFQLRAGVMAYVAGQPQERDIIPKAREGEFQMTNARWVPCVDWRTETPLGRESDEDITLLAELASTFPSGLASSSIQGIQFASVAGIAYERAASSGLGKHMDRSLFLQDIPT
jgi:ornithine cyclodeaminase/alanine dehydrogenase-like protein (mu-crystallin family)